MNHSVHLARRKYFIADSIQPRMLWKLVLSVAAVIAITGVGFYLLSYQDLSSEYAKAHSQIQNTRELLLPWLIGANILTLVLACFFFLVPSHRIAGPIFNLSRTLKRIEKGDFPDRIAVRKNDMLTDFADSLDRAMKAISNRISKVRTDLRTLEARLDSLASEGKISEADHRSMRDALTRSLERLSNS